MIPGKPLAEASGEIGYGNSFIEWFRYNFLCTVEDHIALARRRGVSMARSPPALLTPRR